MLKRFLKKKHSPELSSELLQFLKQTLEVDPMHEALYAQAFRHKSKSKKQENGIKNSNERLEYLGDAVLGMITGEYLYQKYPNKTEGFLTQMRSRIVSRENLNHYGNCLNLEPLISYQRGKFWYDW